MLGRQRQRLAAPLQPLRGEQHARARIVQPRGDGARPEAREDGDDRQPQFEAAVQDRQNLRNHGQRQSHAVARFQAHGGQAVGHPIGLAAQLREGHLADGPALGFPNASHPSVDGSGAGRGLGPAVQTVVRDIDSAAHEPLRPLGAVGRIEHLAVRVEPLDAISRIVSSQKRSGFSREKRRKSSRSANPRRRMKRQTLVRSMNSGAGSQIVAGASAPVSCCSTARLRRKLIRNTSAAFPFCRMVSLKFQVTDTGERHATVYRKIQRADPGGGERF